MAQTGAIFGTKCYTSTAEAVDAYYSQTAPAFTAGEPAHLLEVLNNAGQWMIYRWTIAQGVRTLDYASPAPLPTFPTCDPAEKFMDGQAAGWGIATAMVAVAALMLVRRGARSG